VELYLCEIYRPLSFTLAITKSAERNWPHRQTPHIFDPIFLAILVFALVHYLLTFCSYPVRMRHLLLVLIAVASVDAFASGLIPEATEDSAAVVATNNAFAVELYGQLKSQPGNLFFSPESISTALAMVYAGARGDTGIEMAKVLHFTLPPERLHPAMGALLHDINAPHEGYELHVANALWGQAGYLFLDDFLKLTKDDYGAGFKTVDFKGATEEARQAITDRRTKAVKLFVRLEWWDDIQ
jgi:serine protease inhibitor